MATGQSIRFATARDGVRIAYATSGSGPPLIKAANWLSHLEFDWDSPVWRHWLRDLSATRTLIRYDERGCGLSDREVDDLSFDSWVSDPGCGRHNRRHPLSAAGRVAGCRRRDRLRGAQSRASEPRQIPWGLRAGDSCAIPRRVSTRSPEMLKQSSSAGPGASIPAGVHPQFMPGAATDGAAPGSTSCNASRRPASAALSRGILIDVMAAAARVRCPTVVLHARGDQRVPFDEGRLLAAQIPDARFVPLESRNHVLLDEPAWHELMAVASDFLGAAFGTEGSHAFVELTGRERELLEWIARGLDNTSIAERTGLQVKTVRNHVTRIYDKLGVRTRAEAIVKAREAGLGGENTAELASGTRVPAR
jgi:DNA-binding CsgD family transcriptional regulator/pimeloyl-ACP methyl ester carboxylesterase